MKVAWLAGARNGKQVSPALQRIVGASSTVADQVLHPCVFPDDRFAVNDVVFFSSAAPSSDLPGTLSRVAAHPKLAKVVEG